MRWKLMMNKKPLSQVPNKWHPVWEMTRTIDTIINELQQKKEEARANDPKAKIQTLRMKGLQLTQYIKEFEQLAEQAGLTLANPATTQAFIKGLTPSIKRDLALTQISGYRMARAAAIKANQVDRLLTALIIKTQPHKQSLEERTADMPPVKEQKVSTTDAPTSQWAWKAAQWLAQTYTPEGPPPRKRHSPQPKTKSSSIVQISITKVYMSAQKSMMVQTYLHTSSKRTKTTALLDSGVTENFINLRYAWWLQLPIKQLENPWPLFNINGTENRNRRLKYYMDLQVQTGTQWTNLCFFLLDLSNHKIILGYSWFAATQPKIDWKRGWIDHTHLPIILRTTDTQKAKFATQTINIPQPICQDQYYIGQVTIHPQSHKSGTVEPLNPKILPEYQCHAKVFSKQASQWLLWHTIWDHAIELLLRAPSTLPGWLLPLTREEKEEVHKFVAEHLEHGTIRESWGPYTANVFYVKKKDEKLRLI
jgi:Retroviral aspartyl protease